MPPTYLRCMRVGDNTIAEIRRFFHSQLRGKMDESEVNANFLLAAETYLGWPRSRIMASGEERLNQSELLLLYDCAKALAEGKPLQYILGEAWFLDRRFLVTPEVLIPRPETEELVRLVLNSLPESGGTALDIGTGSGCIPITLKLHRPGLGVFACDISPGALKVAAINAERLQAEIGFFRCDILTEAVGGSFDLIISNPPYILQSEKVHMETGVYDHEPTQALFAPGNDPVIFYRKIIDICRKQLNPGGHLFFELNPQTAAEVEEIARATGIFNTVRLLKDMSGKTRFLHGRKT